MTETCCLACGAPTRRRRIKDGEPERAVCTACGRIHYEDPKVAACTIFETADGVVLVRRAIGPGLGKWVFPGGYVDRGEPVEEAAAREAREETGMNVRIEDLVGVYSYRGIPVVVVVYAARIESGTLAPLDECLEARAFTPASIPWEDLAFQSTRSALEDYLRRRGREPSMPAAERPAPP